MTSVFSVASHVGAGHSAKADNWRSAKKARMSSIFYHATPPSASQMQLAEGGLIPEKNTTFCKLLDAIWRRGSLVPSRWLSSSGHFFLVRQHHHQNSVRKKRKARSVRISPNGRWPALIRAWPVIPGCSSPP